jgi:hypothetical protein
MTDLGVVTTFKEAGPVVVAEGEGAGAYPALERFRRSVVWVKGSYLLVLDDIRGAKESEITWLVQADALEAVDAKLGRFRLKSGPAALDLELVSDRELSACVDDSPAQHRGKKMGLKQVQAKAKARAVRFAALFDVWARGGLKVELAARDEDHAVVVVTGPEFKDTWEWQAAPALSYTSSVLKGRREGGFSVEVGPADQARIPYDKIPPLKAAVRP